MQKANEVKAVRVASAYGSVDHAQAFLELWKWKVPAEIIMCARWKACSRQPVAWPLTCTSAVTFYHALQAPVPRDAASPLTGSMQQLQWSAQMLRTAAAISQEHATAEALIREQQPDRQNGYEKDSSLMVQRCQEAYAELVVPHCRCAELLLFPRMLA